ncbi:hypothetical protein PG993_005532 [Apiospora rasikravindrae]|uniref:Uncharacterized protein n=1 Tax=Apiospora rasikravindrae TaxID=990691 RepID=A0ABR1TFU4_9PEZI
MSLPDKHLGRREFPGSINKVVCSPLYERLRELLLPTAQAGAVFLIQTYVPSCYMESKAALLMRLPTMKPLGVSATSYNLLLQVEFGDGLFNYRV